MNHGVDRYKRPHAVSLREEHARQREREAYAADAGQRPVAHAAAEPQDTKEREDEQRFPQEPQENLLYFIEKNAPLLEPWQREIVRIVRKIAQYFYPQRQTQVMNEGWATFWHYTLLNTLYDDGYVHRRLHDGVPAVAHERDLSAAGSTARTTRGINPYALGFAMYTRPPAHLRGTDRRGPPLVPATSPGADWLRQLDLRDAQLQGRELHRASTCPRT